MSLTIILFPFFEKIMTVIILLSIICSRVEKLRNFQAGRGVAVSFKRDVVASL